MVMLQNIEVNKSASAIWIFATDKITSEFMSAAGSVQYSCQFCNTLSQTKTVLLT
jgi:hypothetical protein